VKEVAVDTPDQAAAKLVYRGAQLALSELAERFGPELLERVPKLWSCMSEALLAVFGSGSFYSYLHFPVAMLMSSPTDDVAQADALLAADPQLGQDLLDCLTVLPVGAAKLTPSLHKRLASLLPALSLATRSKFAVVRYAVAKSFATLCDIIPTEGLRFVVESVIPVLSDPLNVDHRRGAIELISRAFSPHFPSFRL
jgi:TATA-binding protein-associated factor